MKEGGRSEVWRIPTGSRRDAIHLGWSLCVRGGVGGMVRYGTRVIAEGDKQSMFNAYPGDEALLEYLIGVDEEKVVP